MEDAESLAHGHSKLTRAPYNGLIKRIEGEPTMHTMSILRKSVTPHGERWYFIVHNPKDTDPDIANAEVIKREDGFDTEDAARAAGFKWCEDNDIELTLE